MVNRVADRLQHDAERQISAQNPAACFHCGLPCAGAEPLSISTDTGMLEVCCHGCKAAAEAILHAGLGAYYRQRTGFAPKVDTLAPEDAEWLQACDLAESQQGYVRELPEHQSEAFLILEGIVCPACAWLNEQQLQNLPGVLQAEVNFAARRARVRWDTQRLRLSEIFRAVLQLGYTAQLYNPARWEQAIAQEQRLLLRQLGVAWALGMQVMMVAFAIYLVDPTAIEPAQRDLLNGLNLLLTLPVVLYSAQAFFVPAWRDLRHGRIGMDTPVSLGILLAFAASVMLSLQRSSVTYFDSVVMFVGFLLLARYLEFMARKSAGEALERLSIAEPQLARRLVADGEHWREERIRAVNLTEGDRVLVRAGERIPADGIILSGESSVDEALLTGESLPLPKRPDDAVLGGSLNVDSPLQIRVGRRSSDSVLAQIVRLLDQTLSERPEITQLADRLAPWFTGTVLLLAAGSAGFGWYFSVPGWYENVLAVLVVSCPCALSLAAPAVVAVASNRLLRAGILLRSGRALEALARVSQFAFDKTGTLTDGSLQLVAIHCEAGVTERDCLRIAAALEAQSEHPIARAFLAHADPHRSVIAADLQNHPGLGIMGSIGRQRYLLGAPRFVAEHSACPLPASAESSAHTVVVLANANSVLCSFHLDAGLRAHALETVTALKRAGLQTALFTGDNLAAAAAVAQTLGIDQVRAQCLPADKLRFLQELQHQAERVVMVGDGVNDAPVLAAADVSIAFASGTDLARAHADFVLLGADFADVLLAYETSKRTLTIIRQNLGWALAYNLVSVPAAACGFIAPWLAALGMSLSSLIVLANALRLRRLQVSYR